VQIHRSLGFVALLTACDPGSVSGPPGTEPGADAGEASANDGGILATSDGGGFPAGATRLPCAVEEVVFRRCGTCHAQTPRFGAPMPLVSWEDFERPAVTRPGMRVRELVPIRLDDPVDPMPEDRPLDPADRTALDRWLAGGGPARAAGDECDPTMPPPDPMPDPTDCTVTHSFLAHGAGDEPYHVPVSAGRGANLYQCFAFNSPFAAGQQTYGWTPVIGDARVLHHIVVFRVPREYPDNSAFECFDMPAGAEVVAAWAPGGTAFELPPDVGLALPGSGESIVLQIHYWNVPGHADAFDRSGIGICAGPARGQTASYLNVGTSSFAIPPRTMGYEAYGGCDGSVTSGIGRAVNVIAAFPHMHQLGRTITTGVLRGGSPDRPEVLVRVDPWSFDNQGLTALETPIRIDPGDSVFTQCIWDNTTADTVTFGERTEDEMCGTGLLVYPLRDSINCL
jgi:hypothetical protein